VVQGLKYSTPARLRGVLAYACAFLAPLASGTGLAGADTRVDAYTGEIPRSVRVSLTWQTP
jgi:hypothetical protein